MAVTTKVTVFRDAMPCGLVDVYQRLRGRYNIEDRGNTVS
jgi:hypothetical protein